MPLMSVTNQESRHVSVRSSTMSEEMIFVSVDWDFR